MALTFGTLLSSQGADAHRRNRFRLFGGNPRNATPVRVRRVKPASARLPTWSPLTGPKIVLGGASRLGDVAAAPWRAPRCEQGEH